MSSSKKKPIKTLILFLIFFLGISAIHVSKNLDVITRQPSPNWSRSIDVGETTFSRPVLSQAKGDEILLLYPVEKGIGNIGVTKLNKDLKVNDQYTVDIKELNFNNIYGQQIHLEENYLYWRNYKNNTLYRLEFDENYKKPLKTEKIIEEVESFAISPEHIAVAETDGDIKLYSSINGTLKAINGPEGLDNIMDVNLIPYDEGLLLQSVREVKNEYEKEVYISWLKDGKWSSVINMGKVSELGRTKLAGVTISWDKNYIYSIIMTKAESKQVLKYLVSGYDKETGERFDFSSDDIPAALKIVGFSDKPILLPSDGNGIEIFVTADTNIDMYSKGSNVIRMVLKGNEIQEVNLVSNTDSWSSNPSLAELSGDRYMFWLETGGWDKLIIRSATDNSQVVQWSSNTNSDDIKEAIAVEVPVFSQLFLLAFGAKLLWLMPTILWFLVLFIFNEKMLNQKFMPVLIGIIIHLISHIISMGSIYVSYIERYMPDIIRFQGASYMVPLIIGIIAYGISKVYDREMKYTHKYESFGIFAISHYLLLNYLYAPYLFIQ